jgi:hypothetical protein
MLSQRKALMWMSSHEAAFVCAATWRESEMTANFLPFTDRIARVARFHCAFVDLMSPPVAIRQVEHGVATNASSHSFHSASGNSRLAFMYVMKQSPSSNQRSWFPP